MISFYIGITGFACAIYYRRELFRSVKNFFFVGVGPSLGGVILFYLLIKNAIELSDPANSESGNSWFGLGPPLVIAVFFLVLGVAPDGGPVAQAVPGLLPAQARGRARRLPRGRSASRRSDRSGRSLRWARSSSATTARTAARRRSTAALGLAGELGDEVVVVFGYAPPGLWGGEIAEHEEAIEEFGEKVMGEAQEPGRGRRASRSRCELVAEARRRGADRGRRRSATRG